jgi:hypothetical protein
MLYRVRNQFQRVLDVVGIDEGQRLEQCDKRLQWHLCWNLVYKDL